MSSSPHSIELISEERKKTIKEEITLDEILLQHMQT